MHAPSRHRLVLTSSALTGLLLLGGCQGAATTGNDDIQAPANDIEGDQPLPNTGRQDDPTLNQEPDAGGAGQDTFGNEGDFQGGDGTAPGG